MKNDEAFARNLMLIGPVGRTMAKLFSRPLPLAAQKLLALAHRLRGKPFHTSRTLPPAKLVRLLDYGDGPLMMECELSTYLGRAVAINGTWERSLVDICRVYLRPGALAVDVGANVGLISLALARIVGPEGKVVSVEPVPDILHRLGRNLALNRATNVQVVAAGMGACEGRQTFFAASDPEEYGKGSLLRNSDITAPVEIEVAITTLDALATTLDRPIALIKMDIQGYELEALRGAAEVLRRDRPAVVFELEMEYLGEHGQSVGDYLNFFAEFGYELFGIHGATLLPLDAQSVFDGNVLAAPIR